MSNTQPLNPQLFFFLSISSVSTPLGEDEGIEVSDTRGHLGRRSVDLGAEAETEKKINK